MRRLIPTVLALVGCSNPPPASSVADPPPQGIASLPASMNTASATATASATEGLPVVPLRFVHTGGDGKVITWKLEADGALVDGAGAVIVRFAGSSVQNADGVPAMSLDAKARLSLADRPGFVLRFGPNDELTGPGFPQITVSDGGVIAQDGRALPAVGHFEGMTAQERAA